MNEISKLYYFYLYTILNPSLIYNHILVNVVSFQYNLHFLKIFLAFF